MNLLLQRRPYGISYLERESKIAVARYDPTSIIGENPVTAWADVNGNSAFDLNVVVGTDANLSILDSGVALHPGGSGNFFSTPDSAAASVTGDITLEWIGYMFDWTPSTSHDVIAKWAGVGLRSYLLRLETDGKVSLFLTANGTDPVTAISALPNGFTAGNLGGIRARWDQSADTVDFESSSDGGVTWNAMGSQQTLTLGGIDDNGQQVEIGSQSNGTGTVIAGKTVRARVYNDATATNVVVPFDPTDAIVNSDTFTSGSTVWTANGDCFVNATGHRGLYSRGSVGLETTAGQLINSPVTIYMVMKPTLASPAANQRLIDARSNASARMIINTDNGNADKFAMFAGSSISISEAFSNAEQVVTGQFLGTGSSKLTVAAGSVTGDAGSQNWDFGSLGMDIAGGFTMQGLFHELLVFNRGDDPGHVSFFQGQLGAKYA